MLLRLNTIPFPIFRKIKIIVFTLLLFAAQTLRAPFLLDGDALGQVPGLVDGAAAEVGDVVAQKLKGDDGDEGLHALRDLWGVNDVLALCVELVVALLRDGDDAPCRARTSLMLALVFS